MSIQYSTSLRNAQLDQIEVVTGASAKLRLYSGAIPANCAAAATGTLVAEMALPADWMADASGGSKAKAGTWQVTGAPAAGTGTVVGYFRVYDNSGTNCHVQGTVTITGGGGDLTLDNPNVANGQTVAINTFTITAGNA